MSNTDKHLHPHTSAVALFATLAVVTVSVIMPSMQAMTATVGAHANVITAGLLFDADGDGIPDVNDATPLGL